MRWFFVVYVGFITICASCSGPDLSKAEGRKVSFSVPNLAGTLVSLSDPELAGKVVLVDLWGTWCPPCVEAIPHLNRLHKTYQDRGFEVVGIAFEQQGGQAGLRSVTRFVEQEKVAYTVLFGGRIQDVEETLPEFPPTSAFPTLYLLDPTGTIRKAWIGFDEEKIAEMEYELKQLLPARSTKE